MQHCRSPCRSRSATSEGILASDWLTFGSRKTLRSDWLRAALRKDIEFLRDNVNYWWNHSVFSDILTTNFKERRYCKRFSKIKFYAVHKCPFLPQNPCDIGPIHWFDAALVNKLVPCARLLSVALEDWRLGLRSRLKLLYYTSVDVCLLQCD